MVMGLYPWISGFVLLGAIEAKLPVTPEQPTITFVWDGNAVGDINERQKFKSGKYANLTDKEFMSALLTEAIAVWNDIPGSYIQIAFQEGAAADDSSDGVFSIITKKITNATTAAYARPTRKENDESMIDDCDIVIADRKTSAQSLAYTIAHEFGHCLGLGHAHTNYNAIMGYARNSSNFALGGDDKAGMIYLYPDPNYWDGQAEYTMCGLIKSRSKSGHPIVLALILLAPMLGIAATMISRYRNSVNSDNADTVV
jgi:hypothetical protein